MEQRNELFSNRLFLRLWQLNRQRHLYAIRSSFIAMMPLVMIGAYAVIINELPIRGYQKFMNNTFGPSWKVFGTLAFNATLQVVTLMLVFAICSNLTRWYNDNRGTKIHANLTGMIGITAYLVSAMPLDDLSSISFSNVDVTGFFVAIIISIVVTELYVRLVHLKNIDRIINDAPDAIVPLAFSSISPAIIIVGLFILLRIILVAFGIYDGITDLFNQFIQNLFAVKNQTIGVAVLYTLATQVLIMVLWDSWT